MASSRCPKGKRYHKKSKSCRTPCHKKGPTWRRSPKGPYYKCIQSKTWKKKSKK